MVMVTHLVEEYEDEGAANGERGGEEQQQGAHRHPHPPAPLHLLHHM
jgi:hypothetical protein